MSSRPAPRVTIGMPVYNGADYLREALDSWLAQEFTEFELVVSDNASTDATGQILADYARRDPRIRVLTRGRNVPAAENFNALVGEARGGYFAWAAHDDLRDPTFLTKAVAVLDAQPEVALCYAQVFLFSGAPDQRARGEARPLPDDGGTRLGQAVALLRWRNPWRWGAVYGLFRLGVLKQTHLFHTPMGLVADVGLMMEIAQLGRLHCIPEFLLLQRVHEASVSHSQGDAMYAGGRGRVVDADTRRFVRSFPISAREQALLLHELRLWSWRSRGRRTGWRRLPLLRRFGLWCGRRWTDLVRQVHGL